MNLRPANSCRHQQRDAQLFQDFRKRIRVKTSQRLFIGYMGSVDISVIVEFQFKASGTAPGL